MCACVCAKWRGQPTVGFTSLEFILRTIGSHGKLQGKVVRIMLSLGSAISGLVNLIISTRESVWGQIGCFFICY